MEFSVSSEMFNRLLPFSFVVDGTGSLVWAGRSLVKLMSSLGAGGAGLSGSWLDHFSVERPTLQGGVRADELARLQGELMVIRPARARMGGLRFRGQVALISHDQWLFSVSPSTATAGDIAAAGLDYSDFAVGDPIFDFMMLLQSERRAFQKSEKAREELLRDHQASEILRRLAMVLSDRQEGALKRSLEFACSELGLDFGRIFLLDRTRAELLPSDCFFVSGRFSSDPALNGFLEATQDAKLKLGEGLAGRVWKSGQPGWSEGHGLPGVGVPLRVSGEFSGVLEVYRADGLENRDPLIRFLETFALQIGVALERTSLEERERQQEAVLLGSAKLSALGEMAAGVAHEINNPLTTILLAAHQCRTLIGSKELSEQSSVGRLTKLFERVERSSERIGKIVSGMRTLARDGGADPFIQHPVRSILEDTLSLCAARFTNGGVELRVDPAATDGFELCCRPVQVSQILLNLLNNGFDAVKKTSEAWVEVRVVRQSDAVSFEVSNSGQKIPADLAGKIMKPFFTTKPVGEGTGLGLSISRAIAEAHRGGLELDLSREHTTFVLKIPATS